MTESSALDAVCVVLYEPQDAINIAATVRSMKNMGARDLRLVRPTDYEPNRIEQIAHHTRDIVDRIRHFDSLDEALADCVHVAGFSGRRRAAKWTRVTPREAAGDLLERSREGTVALLFGREDDGLPGDALDRAHVIVTIPTTDHASLNLAQAVLVALYELHLAAGESRAHGRPRKDAPPPTGREWEQFFDDTERALHAIDFLKTRNPEHVMRGVRSVFYRADPNARELLLFRAMSIEVMRTIERVERLTKARTLAEVEARGATS